MVAWAGVRKGGRGCSLGTSEADEGRGRCRAPLDVALADSPTSESIPQILSSYPPSTRQVTP